MTSRKNRALAAVLAPATSGWGAPAAGTTVTGPA
jgi:hypothetical protein